MALCACMLQKLPTKPIINTIVVAMFLIMGAFPLE
jgi:hypothetical protein